MSSFFNGQMPNWGSPAGTAEDGAGRARKMKMARVADAIRGIGGPGGWESTSDWFHAAGAAAHRANEAGRKDLAAASPGSRDNPAPSSTRTAPTGGVSTSVVPSTLLGSPEAPPFLGSPQSSTSQVVRQLLLRRFSARNPITGGRR